MIDIQLGDPVDGQLKIIRSQLTNNKPKTTLVGRSSKDYFKNKDLTDKTNKIATNTLRIGDNLVKLSGDINVGNVLTLTNVTNASFISPSLNIGTSGSLTLASIGVGIGTGGDIGGPTPVGDVIITGSANVGKISLDTTAGSASSSVICVLTPSASYNSIQPAAFLWPANALANVAVASGYAPIVNVNSTSVTLSTGLTGMSAGTFDFNYMIF